MCAESDIQIVSNEAGEAITVIVPIALWKEIASEIEAAYRSTMRWQNWAWVYFLGLWITAQGVAGVAPATLRNFEERKARLYE